MSKKETVEVYVDSNEASQNPELLEVLVLHEDVEDYRIEPLSEGDIHIDNCIFERKTPSDFASSMEKGRLRDQVERMAGREETPAVLIEGDMEDFDNLKHTNIDSKSIRGMIASIEMKNGVRVKCCSNSDLLADVAVRMARKEKEDVDTIQARQTEAIKDTTFLEDIFLSIDGVGVKTAEKLAEPFEYSSDVIEADIEDFKSIENVGEKTAQKIHSTLHSSDDSNDNSEQESKKVYKI